jgi:anti-sigma regulatory factor (Ser/Thr protein kinase)
MMATTLWAQRLPAPSGDGVAAGRRWSLATAADVTAARARLREEFAAYARPGEPWDDVLLAFEELASNGLRHGERPVRATVVVTGAAWQIEVTDTATDRPPVPAVGRDAADGGLGLHLVARLASAHGWWSDGTRKHVWARLTRPTPVARQGLPAGRREPRAG